MCGSSVGKGEGRGGDGRRVVQGPHLPCSLGRCDATDGMLWGKLEIKKVGPQGSSRIKWRKVLRHWGTSPVNMRKRSQTIGNRFKQLRNLAEVWLCDIKF